MYYEGPGGSQTIGERPDYKSPEEQPDYREGDMLEGLEETPPYKDLSEEPHYSYYGNRGDAPYKVGD